MWESSHCSLVSRAFHWPLQRDPAGITVEQSRCQLLPSAGQRDRDLLYSAPAALLTLSPGLWTLCQPHSLPSLSTAHQTLHCLPALWPAHVQIWAFFFSYLTPDISMFLPKPRDCSLRCCAHLLTSLSVPAALHRQRPWDPPVFPASGVRSYHPCGSRAAAAAIYR